VLGDFSCFAQVLDTLVEIGQISSEAAANAKARLSELQHAVEAAVSEERTLTTQAAQLAKHRDVSAASAQKLIAAVMHLYNPRAA
jgi:hypothetical protein